MGNYYRINRLLSKKDINGKTPEIFIVSGTRTAGKTFAVKEFLLSDFLKTGNQFLLQFRKNFDLDACETAFMEDIKNVFSGYTMTSHSERRGAYKVLTLSGPGIADETECGFATYLNAYETIKRASSRFEKVGNRFMDEFQSENGDYIDREISKYMSIHYSIARGYGKQYRYVREFLVSNTFSKYNPYFIALGVSDRIEPGAKFIRGDGWVLEITNNENAQAGMLNSGFAKAFSNSSYIKSAAENQFILDNDAFINIENTRDMMYYATIVFYSDEADAPDKIAVYVGYNRVYCSGKVNNDFKRVITFNPRTHDESTILSQGNNYLLNFFRDSFDRGYMFFESGRIKKIVLDIMKYQ